MKIEKDKWVAIHYTVKDENENEIDSSVDGAPLGYVHGRGYLISGLEKALEGKQPGDKFSVVIQPAEGYGEYDSRLIIEVERNQFEMEGDIQVGMKFSVMTPQGPAVVRVTEVNGDKIKVNGNHELAGKVLHFDAEVVEVRDATEEELNPRSCGGSCGNCSGNCGGDCGGDCNGNCDSGCGGSGCGCN